MTGQRRFAKLAIAVHFAVESIVTFQPQKPEDMKAHSNSIRQKLSDKGIGVDSDKTQKHQITLPLFVDKLLRSLVTKSDELVAKSKKAVEAAGAPEVADEKAVPVEAAEGVQAVLSFACR